MAALSPQRLRSQLWRNRHVEPRRIEVVVTARTGTSDEIDRVPRCNVDCHRERRDLRPVHRTVEKRCTLAKHVNISRCQPCSGELAYHVPAPSGRSSPAHNRIRARPRPHVQNRRNHVWLGHNQRIARRTAARNRAEPSHLSGGERRRLEIARSLTLQPSFILLDDPFSGIDPLTVKDLQEIIRELSRSGIGVLITDHNVRETLNVTDRAYILRNGKIFRKGRPDELSNDPEVRRVYLGDHFRLN